MDSNVREDIHKSAERVSDIKALNAPRFAQRSVLDGNISGMNTAKSFL